MKAVKRAISLMLILSFAICLAGCNTKKLSHDKLVNYLDKEAKFDEVDDLDDFKKIFGKLRAGNEGYISLKDKKAQKIYDKLYNSSQGYPDYDIVEATAAYSSDSDGINYLFMFTFDDEKDAEKLYKKIEKVFELNGDSDEEKGMSYVYSCKKSSSGKYTIRNAYLEKNTLLIVMASTKDTDFVEDFCDYFKLQYDLDD